MIEPTGYTALDLIGFTDRGYYDPSATYVKNDLVHDDNESIWRVLIDDTSGVTPTEGLNYTIFIRNPQDAAKQMIAPVDTSPTANAHAAGTQIIYHDVLYDVTTAIAAGGALVVYPTSGYNIKPAPLVTSQIQALQKFNKVIFISDSYGNYGTPHLLIQTAQKMGLDSNNYVAVNEGACGFAHANPSAHRFIDLLQSVSGTFVSAEVSHIIVLGGANDALESVADVSTYLNQFIAYVNSTYPNAQLLVGMIANTTDATNVRKIGNVSVWYQDILTQQYKHSFIPNSDKILKSTYYILGDNIHPTDFGVSLVANMISKAIKNDIAIKITRFKEITIDNIKYYMSLQSDSFHLWTNKQKNYSITPTQLIIDTPYDIADFSGQSTYCVGSYYQDCAQPLVARCTATDNTIEELIGSVIFYNKTLQFRPCMTSQKVIKEITLPEFHLDFPSIYA